MSEDSNNWPSLKASMEILPGILAHDETDFRNRLLHSDLRAVAPTFHVDVLDGSLFGATCWADPERVGEWKNLPEIELHCMVQNPWAVAEAWHAHVPTLRRVIIHREIGRSITNTISKLRALDLEVVVAVNPSTPVDEIARLSIDALMVMGVEPGASGQAFLGEPILSKMRRAKALFPNLLQAVDGGVSLKTISQITTAGAHRCVASSALWKAENPAEAYQELLNKTR